MYPTHIDNARAATGIGAALVELSTKVGMSDNYRFEIRPVGDHPKRELFYKVEAISLVDADMAGYVHIDGHSGMVLERG